MKKIEGDIDISGIKRCYVDGAVIEFKCPDCNRTLRIDLGEDYLSYPELGEDSPIFTFCDDCQEYYGAPVIVKRAVITIEYDETKVVKE